MKSITLSKLVLKNFKGVRDLSADFSSMTEVYGDNATGKTTLFDAFSWLLFDKDSQNKKDFDIKTLDANGKVLHGLEHEVEGTLVVAGRPLVLRKVFSEKWTKKRGSATSDFTGHTTDYFIDGVPVKQKEFKDRVDGLIDEHIFKLLTSPTYFNEQMDWKTRRKILLEVCGDVSGSDVIGANGALSKLPSILGDRSIEDHRKVIAARRSDINKELEKIPVRIDEAERSKPDTSGLNQVQLQSEIDQLKFEVESKESEMTRLQSGGEVAVQENRMREIEGELLQIKNRAQSGAMDAVSAHRNKVMNATNEANRLANAIQRLTSQLGSNQLVIQDRKADAQRLREQWTVINAEEFVHNHDHNDSCPACGQSLPAEQIQAAHDKALAEFNSQKSQRLERISSQGKSAMAEVQRMESENARLEAELSNARDQLATAEATVSTLQSELAHMQDGIQDVTEDPEYTAKQRELETVKNKIAGLRQSVLDDVQRMRSQLIDVRDEIRGKEKHLSAFSQVITIDARIDELKHQERMLAEEYERLEEELYLTEEFIRTKVNLLEAKINSKFRHAQFKLFEQQINGGVAETCETLYQGVPYGSGLNNAARINVGLDIINTLSEHYGLTAPIFVDNAEAVTKLAETSGQMIKLTVPPSFDKLPAAARERLISLYGDYDKAVKAWEEQNKKLRVETSQRVKEAV